MDITGTQLRITERVGLAPEVADTHSQSDATPRVNASEDALQVAVRLKVVLGSNKRLVAVSGIRDNDGSSHLAAGLAMALATLDSPVLIVDGNTRRSRLREFFVVDEQPGLLNVLSNDRRLDEAIRRVSPANLEFLPLGRSSRSLTSLIGASGGAGLLEELRSQYRYVVVDCGTACDSPEAMLLASLSDGVVAAVGTAFRRRDELVSFQQALQGMQIPLLGVVLTRGAERT